MIHRVFVVNQSGFEWWQFLLGGAVGSFLAACIVLGIERFLSRKKTIKEVLEQRSALLARLKLELERIANIFPAYDVTQAILRDKIPITCLDLLLDGRVIKYTEERELIDLLLNLKVALQKYNNIVDTFTINQISSPMMDSAHEQGYVIVKERHENLISAKNDLLTHTAFRETDIEPNKNTPLR